MKFFRTDDKKRYAGYPEAMGTSVGSDFAVGLNIYRFHKKNKVKEYAEILIPADSGINTALGYQILQELKDGVYGDYKTHNFVRLEDKQVES